MTTQDIQTFANDLVSALLQELPQDRVAAVRALAEKGLRLEGG